MSEETTYDWINTVQLTESGYLVNGSLSVPNAHGNRHYRAVQDWINAGNTPDPDPAQSLEAVRARRMAEADAKKKQLLDGGFTLNGITYDSDINARMAYAELGMKFSQDPTYSTPWKASASAWVTMDATLYQQIASAGEAHIGGVFSWLAGVQAAIATAETIADLLAIEI